VRGLNVVIVVPVLWLFSCVRGPEPESGAEPMSGAVSEAAPIGRGELTAEPGEVVVDASSGPRSTREVQVRLTNAGAGPLTIEQVDTSCSCTIAESLGMRTLEPAESVMLSLQLRPMVKTAKRLKRHLERLVTWFDHPITNASAEGFNSVIQALKTAARGFRSFANYRIRILFHCGRLDMAPAAQMSTSH